MSGNKLEIVAEVSSIEIEISRDDLELNYDFSKRHFLVGLNMFQTEKKKSNNLRERGGGKIPNTVTIVHDPSAASQSAATSLYEVSSFIRGSFSQRQH